MFEWLRHNIADAIVTVDSKTLRYWKIDHAKSQPNLNDSVIFGKTANVRTGRGDPHSDNRFIGATNDAVLVWDWRDPSDGVLKVSSAHPTVMRDLDVNPNKPHQIVTAGKSTIRMSAMDCLNRELGEDASMRFWDLRRPDAPVLIMYGHAHWIWQVEYNHVRYLLFGAKSC